MKAYVDYLKEAAKKDPKNYDGWITKKGTIVSDPMWGEFSDLRVREKNRERHYLNRDEHKFCAYCGKVFFKDVMVNWKAKKYCTRRCKNLQNRHAKNSKTERLSAPRV